MDDPYVDNMVGAYLYMLAYNVSVTETYIGELFHSTIDSIMIDFYRHADPLREHVNVVVFSDNLLNHFNC